MKQNWKYNHQNKENRNGRGMEERHQVRTKIWWPGRYNEDERTIKRRNIKQQNSMEKEMENKVKDNATPLSIVSQKYTSLQLWYLGIIAKWPKETEQFP